MRHPYPFLFILFAIALVGCTGQTTDTAVTPPVVKDGTSTSGADQTATVVSADGSEIALSPENTTIQFVGTHVGPTPDPKARTGTFEEFAGTAVIADDELKSISIEIQMASVQTGMDKLNNHLQQEDFFSVREYPTAKFETTKIVRNEDGDHLVTANLTLHSKTNEVSFPASVGMVDGQLTLNGKLRLDRTEYGMDKKLDGVNKEVDLTFSIGKRPG